jgi:DNA gyrase subunit A
VVVTKPGDEVVLSTAHGMAIRFRQSDVRPMGRDASGVKGISIRGDDRVVGMVVADPEAHLLTVCANGYGKRTPFGPNSPQEAPDSPPMSDGVEPAAVADDEPAEGEGDESASSQRSYRTQNRGGKGLHDIKTTERNGPVMGISRVYDSDEVMMITAHGKLQRIPVADISVYGRNTQGVRIMSLDEDDVLVAVKRVPHEESNGTAPADAQEA